MPPTRARIEKNGYQPQSQDGDQGLIKLDRHRAKHQYWISRFQPGLTQLRRKLPCRSIEIGVACGPLHSTMDIGNRCGLGHHSCSLRKQVRDIHG
jgi:hypothetical protein